MSEQNETMEARPEDAAEPIVAANSRPLPAPTPRAMGGASDRQRGVFIALAIFFGGLGIHNFYARRTLAGVIELGIAVTLSWTLIAPICVWLFAVVEACAVRNDGAGKALR